MVPADDRVSANHGTVVFQNLGLPRHKAQKRFVSNGSNGSSQPNHKGFQQATAQFLSPRLRSMHFHLGMPVAISRFVSASPADDGARVLDMENRGDRFQRLMGGSNQPPPLRPPVPQTGQYGQMEGSGRSGAGGYGARSAPYPLQQFRGNGAAQFEFGLISSAG